MKIFIGLILLLMLSWSPASAKEDMTLRALMESKETSVVTMLIGGAGLTLRMVNTHLAAEGKPLILLTAERHDFANRVRRNREEISGAAPGYR